MTEEHSRIQCAVFSQDPGNIYFLSTDVIDALRDNMNVFEQQIAKGKANHLDESPNGRLQIAALVGASAALEALTQELELLGIAMATESIEIIDKAQNG